MEFRLLGPVEVRAAGQLVDLGPRKRRVLLALLALEAGHTVPVDRLIDLVWGDEPPDAARRVVIVHVSRLRATLDAAGAAKCGVELVTAGTGYSLRTDPNSIDVFRFRQAVTRAAAIMAPAERATALRAALGLWRGPALADVADGRLRELVCGGIEALRLQAIEDRVDADLATGRHVELCPELIELVAAHPARERMTAQLILASYRSGRQNDAAAAYERLRRHLAEDLGIDPGADVRRLFERILRADPDLDAEPARAQPVPPAPRPRQLPADIRGFGGRARQIAALDTVLDDRSDGGLPIVAISGMGGIGKTSLAVHWAHRIADRFPDGALYANLQGFAATPPVAPVNVITGFLRALGVPAAQVPVGLDEAGQLFRSILADRRTLILLDNAASADQARPVFPGSGGNLVIVTSRDRMAGLAAVDGAHLRSLDVLDREDAVALLHRFLESDDRQSEPASRLAEICARLPLALRVAAANFDPVRYASLAAYVDDISAGHPLSALATDGDERATVRSIFTWSYAHLDASAARAFRLFGGQPMATWDTRAAAALLGTDLAGVRRVTDELLRGHLLDDIGGDRFAMHDLLAAYAAELTDDAERDAAVIRILDYYRAAASAAVDVMLPAERHRRPVVAPIAAELPVFDGIAGASAWLNTELPNLVTVTRLGGRYAVYGVELSRILLSPLNDASNNADSHAIFSAVLATAQATGDRYAEGTALHGLGLTYQRLGRSEEASAVLDRALAARVEAGDVLGQAATLYLSGYVVGYRGEHETALEKLHQSLELYQSHGGDRYGEGVVRNSIGAELYQLRRQDQALTYLKSALAIMREIGHIGMEAHVSGTIGSILLSQMRYAQARAYMLRALTTAATLGQPALHCFALRQAGWALTRVGDLGAAHGYLTGSVEMARRFNTRDQLVTSLYRHAEWCIASGELAGAAVLLSESLDLAREFKFRHAEMTILATLGNVRLGLGDADGATAAFRLVVAIAEEVGDVNSMAEGRSGMGAVAYAAGRPGEAAALHEEALAMMVSEDAEAEYQVRVALVNALRACGREDSAGPHETRIAELDALRVVPELDGPGQETK